MLFNFTRTMRYIIALPATIILWLLATGILIGITSAMHLYTKHTAPQQAFSQAYWYAVIAAVHYFILTVILMVNMLGYFLGHYPQHFALTDGQRTLILQTIALGAWLIIGAAVFQRVMHLSFADGLYFSDITILTLGFGDVTPQTAVGKGLVFPYAVVGIIILGLVIGSIHDILQELQYVVIVQKHIEQGREATAKHSVMAEAEDEETKLQHTDSLRLTETMENIHRREYSRKLFRYANIIALLRGHRRSAQKVLVIKNEKDRFDAMRAIQHEAMLFHRWYRLIWSLIAFGIVWTCGAAVFWALEEHFTYFTALYFSFCSLLTIGYGDLTPTTNASRPFFVAWSLIAIPTMTTLISEMSNTVVALFKRSVSIVADWTLLPHTGKYTTFLRKIMPFLSYLRQPQERVQSAQGVDVERDHGGISTVNGQSRSIDELETEQGNASFQLALKLASTIQAVSRDVLEGRKKQYPYEEWAEFARLIRFTGSIPGGVLLNEDEYGIISWDWIGDSSPMLASQSEPEWVLNRLCESLIRYISVQGQQRDR